MSLKCVFFGTPPFAAQTLTALLNAGIQVVAVVSRPDRPKGRSGKPVPTPVKEVALAHGVPVYQPEKASTPEFIETLRPYEADLFVVVAYGEIMRQGLLDLPKRACLNVHASLLPKYRGAAPIQKSIIDGETETGVTIMHMVRKMDAGDIIRQARIPLDETINAGQLEQALCDLGCETLLQTLSDFERGEVNSVSQDESLVSIAPKLELEDSEVHWERSARDLHNLVRGTQPRPGAWCWCWVKGQKKRLKLIATSVVEGQGAPAGTLLQWDSRGLKVACGSEALSLEEIQLEGKRRMAFGDFVRGLACSDFSLLPVIS